MRKVITLFVAAGCLLALLWSGCKGPDEMEIDPVPYITIENVNPTSLIEFQEDVIIEVKYEDQDGDLGFPNPDSLSLEVWDSRLSQPDLYHLQPLVPTDTSLHIQGIVEVVVPSPFLLGNGNSEKVNYSIRIRDRAGNWSNSVVTRDITITE